MTASASGPIDGHMMQVSRLDGARSAGNSRKPTPLKPVARRGSTPSDRRTAQAKWDWL
jgi:hypothetical protein